MPFNNRGLISALGLGAAASFILAGAAIASLTDLDHLVSQKGKRFGPHDVSLHIGEHVTIVNDDADFVHHAYVDAETFAFDSGDIEPGAKAIIAFPKEGDFTVLCAIHPSMKLKVQVR